MPNIKELAYWVAIAHLERFRRIKINNLAVQILHEKKISFSDFFILSDVEYRNEFALNQREIDALRNAYRKLPNIFFAIKNLIKRDINIITLNSKNYPKKLKNNLKIGKSPTVLYTQGNLKIFNEKTIAIVGSRDASGKSLEFTDKIAERASRNFEVVVSGLAKGVDRTALESALKYFGQTIVVLPQGIATFNSGFKKYKKQIAAGDMLVVSAFPSKAGWSVEHALARNPIIYGLADKIYIAETADSGGTWAGALDGLKKERKVFVRMPEPEEKCANILLIENGAIPVDISGNEIPHAALSLEFFDERKSKAPFGKKSPSENMNLLEPIFRLLESIDNAPMSSADFIRKLKLDINVGSLTSKLKNAPEIEIVSGTPLKFKLRDFKGEYNLFSH